MVRESGYSLRARKDVDDGNVKINTSNQKDAGNPSTVKPNVSDLAKNTKAKRVEKGAAPSPGTRKSLRLEGHKAPSPLNTLDKGKKSLPSNSPGQRKHAEECNVSEDKTMEEEGAVQDTIESENSKSQSGSGKRRKGMSARAFRKMFKVQCVRTVEFVSDDEEIEGADDFSTDAVVTDKIVLKPPAVNGLKESQSGPSLKESLPDHERGGTNSSSMVNLDSVNLERSFLLTRSQDGTVQSEIRDTCMDSKDDEEIEGADVFSTDAVVTDKIVLEPPAVNGLKVPQSGPSLKESLPDNERGGPSSPSMMNLDSVNLERSFLLTRSQDGTVHSEIRDICLDPKDTDGLMDGYGKLSVDPTAMDNVVDQPPDSDGLKNSCISLHGKVLPTNSSNGLMDESEKLSVDPTIMDNVVDQPSDGNVLEDSCTNLCENVILTNSSFLRSADSLEKEISDCFVKSKNCAMSENAPEVRPSPENNSVGLSEICGVCSKRKRVSPGSQEKDHCSCRATINMDVIQNLSMTPPCKDGGDQEEAAAATLETACLNNASLLKEPHSDHLINGRGNVCANGSNNGENLKRKSRPIADTRTSKFLEYWLPVLTSNHQLEQYCAILLSSSLHLCSFTKTGRIGALHDTLENVRKVCDHSYLRDLSLQERLIYKERRPAEDVLDIGIKASGKIELLDMMLTEIKNRGSQVLILFQSIRGESATNGDILAEFLHKRFGEDSYEHVEGISPKKQDAVNRFNKKEKGVFVFLLETRACSSAIKLLSLDNVIIYNSDWNPLNDLKALQKVSIGSKPEQIKVFRLYTSFTFEERSLILAKQNANSTECSLQTSSRAIIDNLLMWGASHLFSKLNDYHAESTPSLYVSTQQSLLTEVIGEFQSILSSCENGDLTTVIAKAYKLEGGWYSSNIPLLGQKQIIVEEWQEPHVFWKKLLDRKTPNWKLSGEPCSRNRKRVPYLDGLPSKPDTVNGDVGNKRRKAANEHADAVLVQVELNWTEVPNPKKGPSTVTTRNESHSLQKNAVTETSTLNANQTCDGAEVNTLEPAETTALSNEKGLHSSLQGQLTELCNILNFSDDVTDSARRFLEYIIKHHQVNSDSPATLHAFIISLCWMAASISKQKVDKKNSLLLAKQHLNYQCTEERAKSVYLKMRSLKKIQLPEQDVNREPLSVDEGVANLASCKLLEVRKELVEKPANEEHETDSQISKIERKCLKRQKRLTLKHQEELQVLKQTWEEKKRILVKDQELETAMVRSLFVEGCSTRKEKLKRLEDALQMKMKEHNLLMEVELKNLVAVQDAAMKEEKQKAEYWLGVTKDHSGQITVTMPPVDDATRVVTDSFQLLEDQNPNGSVFALGNDAENPASKDQSVELTTEVQVEEVPQIAQNEKVSPDKNNSSFAEQLNQTESDSQSPSNFAEVASQEPADAVTTVQLSNGVLEEGELQEVELLVEEAAPTTENQSTVKNSETVPIVDLMPITEQPDGILPGVVENQSQHTSTDIQVEVSRFVDRSNNAMSDIELQNQVVPALGNERNSDLGAAERNTEQLHAEPLTVENQSTFYEVPMSETAENLIHHQSNVEGLSNTDQGRNSSGIAEVAETELHRDEPVPKNEDLNMRSVTHHHDHHPRPRLSLNPAAHQLPSPNPPPFVDPIQYELEKMTKEKDQLQKSHVDMVARLKSDCEKEIEEMINQIKQKYQMKLQEAESEHTIRKTQAEMNINKMQANMKVAEASRYKCLDARLPGPSGNHLGASSSGVYMQQMRQLARLPSPRYPAGASSTFQPSTSSAGASPTFQPSTSQQNRNSIIQPVRPNPISSTFQPSTSQQNRNSIIQPVRPNPMRLSTGTSHSATTTAAQSVQHTPPLFATPHPRPPPYVSSINHYPHTQTGELRSPAMHHLSVSPVPLLQSVSPAPHIQAVSPAPHLQSVSPAPHLQSVSPAPHIQTSRPSAGPPVPPTTYTYRPQYQPLILRNAQQSIPQSSQNGNGPQSRLSIQPNQSPSAFALLMEMDRGSCVPTNTASVSRGDSLTGAILESSELGAVGKVHSNRSPLPVGHDVVCLSDDD